MQTDQATDNPLPPRDRLTRRTFLLSSRADRALVRLVAANQMLGRDPASVSSLLRTIIVAHLAMPEAERRCFYERYRPLAFNATLPGDSPVRTLDDYRRHRADKLSRTFTLWASQLRRIEHLAARNRYEGHGPDSVNALLLHLVNEYLQQADSTFFPGKAQDN